MLYLILSLQTEITVHTDKFRTLSEVNRFHNEKQGYQPMLNQHSNMTECKETLKDIDHCLH